MCAISGGRSVDTTMGFSPQSGLENATRHGDLDVFAVLYMMDRHGWSAEEVRRQLAKGGGLAGLSGVAGGDVRDMGKAGGRGAAAGGARGGCPGGKSEWGGAGAVEGAERGGVSM